MAYLRNYSIIPIFILLIELGWISWMRFRPLIEINHRDWAMQYTAQIMLSNVGVLNTYAFGQNNTRSRDYCEDEEHVKRFGVQSTLITFTHHTSILVMIGYIQPPEFFISTLAIKAGSEDFYLMIGSLIGIGVLSLVINLFYFKWNETCKCCPTKPESVSPRLQNPMELQEVIKTIKTDNA